MLAKTRLWLVTLALAGTTLACGAIGSSNTQSQPAAQPTVNISPTSAQQLEQKVQTFSNQPSQSTLTVTNDEMTSYLRLRVANQANFPLGNPTVYFTQGKMHVTGDLQGSQVPAKGKADVTVNLSASNGRIAAKIEGASINGVGLPSFLLTPLNQAVDQQVAQVGDRLTVTDVQIGEGQATITGTTK